MQKLLVLVQGNKRELSLAEEPVWVHIEIAQMSQVWTDIYFEVFKEVKRACPHYLEKIKYDGLSILTVLNSDERVIVNFIK